MPLQALEYGLEVVYRLIGHYKALPRVVLEELAHDIKIVLAGGVASNSRLREMLQTECKKHCIALYYPDPILCTDNAAMIGCAAYYKYKAGGISDLDLDAVPDLPL